jgi:hypothetical protein
MTEHPRLDHRGAEMRAERQTIWAGADDGDLAVIAEHGIHGLTSPGTARPWSGKPRFNRASEIQKSTVLVLRNGAQAAKDGSELTLIAEAPGIPDCEGINAVVRRA